VNRFSNYQEETIFLYQRSNIIYAAANYGRRGVPPTPSTYITDHQGSGVRVQGAGFRVLDAGFRVQGSGCRVQGAERCSMQEEAMFLYQRSNIIYAAANYGRRGVATPPEIQGYFSHKKSPLPRTLP